MQYTAQLRCRYDKINAQRIKIRLRFILSKLLALAPHISQNMFAKYLRLNFFLIVKLTSTGVVS